MDSGENAIYMVSTLDYKGYVMFFFENGKVAKVDLASIVPKTTKDTQGVAVMTLKKGHVVKLVRDYRKGEFAKPYRYKTKNLPASGATLSAEDAGEQLSLI